MGGGITKYAQTRLVSLPSAARKTPARRPVDACRSSHPSISSNLHPVIYSLPTASSAARRAAKKVVVSNIWRYVALEGKNLPGFILIAKMSRRCWNPKILQQKIVEKRGHTIGRIFWVPGDLRKKAPPLRGFALRTYPIGWRGTAEFKMPRGGYHGEISFSGAFRELMMPPFARPSRSDLLSVSVHGEKLNSCMCYAGAARRTKLSYANLRSSRSSRRHHTLWRALLPAAGGPVQSVVCSLSFESEQVLRSLQFDSLRTFSTRAAAPALQLWFAGAASASL